MVDFKFKYLKYKKKYLNLLQYAGRSGLSQDKKKYIALNRTIYAEEEANFMNNLAKLLNYDYNQIKIEPDELYYQAINQNIKIDNIKLINDTIYSGEIVIKQRKIEDDIFNDYSHIKWRQQIEKIVDKLQKLKYDYLNKAKMEKDKEIQTILDNRRIKIKEDNKEDNKKQYDNNVKKQKLKGFIMGYQHKKQNKPNIINFDNPHFKQYYLDAYNLGESNMIKIFETPDEGYYNEWDIDENDKIYVKKIPVQKLQDRNNNNLDTEKTIKSKKGKNKKSKKGKKKK